MSKTNDDTDSSDGREEDETSRIRAVSEHDESEEPCNIPVDRTENGARKDKCNYLTVFLSFFLRYLYNIIVYRSVVHAFIITCHWLCNTHQMDIPTRPAKPPRTQARGTLVSLKRYRNCSRSNLTGLVMRRQNKRINWRPSKNRKEASQCRGSIGITGYGQKPSIKDEYKFNYTPKSSAKNGLSLPQQETCPKLNQATMPSLKYDNYSHDINTCRKELYSYEQTFQKIHQDSVVSHCTLSFEREDIEDDAGEDPVDNETQPIQVTDQFDTVTDVISLRERNERRREQNVRERIRERNEIAIREQRAGEQGQMSLNNEIDLGQVRYSQGQMSRNNVIDLDQVRYSQYRMISIRDMRRLQATLNNLDENRSPENPHNQRPMIVDLALNRGPIINLRRNRQERFQNEQRVASHSSHGEGKVFPM